MHKPSSTPPTPNPNIMQENRRIAQSGRDNVTRQPLDAGDGRMRGAAAASRPVRFVVRNVVVVVVIGEDGGGEGPVGGLAG